MLKQAGKAWLVIVCAMFVVVVAGVAAATEIHWQSAVTGFWDDELNWAPQERPLADDDAKHVNPALLSSIRIRQGEACLSFEGVRGR